MSASLLTSPPVRADEQSARGWFEAGVKSYEEGQYAAALAAFQEAYRLSRRPGLLFSIAQALRRSYENDGDVALRQGAIEHYERYIAEAPDGDRSAEAQSWLAKLRSESLGSGADAPPPALDSSPAPAQLPTLAETVPAPGDALEPPQRSSLAITGSDGALVYVDGRRVGSLPMPALRLEHGRHTVEVLEAGRHGVRYVVELEPGVTRRLHLTGSPTARHVASWVFVGAGSAALVASSVFGYLALQREDEARALQDTPGARLDFDEAVGARDRLRAAAALSAGLGVASVLGGTVSLVTERPSAAVSNGLAIRRPALYVAFPMGLALGGTF